MAGKRTYDVGVLVEVLYDPLDKVPNIATFKYKGTQHRISRRIDYGARGVMFELEDCTGENDVPYVFLAHELRVV